MIIKICSKYLTIVWPRPTGLCPLKLIWAELGSLHEILSNFTCVYSENSALLPRQKLDTRLLIMLLCIPQGSKMPNNESLMSFAPFYKLKYLSCVALTDGWLTLGTVQIGLRNLQQTHAGQDFANQDQDFSFQDQDSEKASSSVLETRFKVTPNMPRTSLLWFDWFVYGSLTLWALKAGKPA